VNGAETGTGYVTCVAADVGHWVGDGYLQEWLPDVVPGVEYVSVLLNVATCLEVSSTLNTF